MQKQHKPTDQTSSNLQLVVATRDTGRFVKLGGWLQWDFTLYSSGFEVRCC